MQQSFTRSKGVLFTEYNLGLLQALLLYNAPAFLSDSQEQRMGAHMHLGTIINVRPSPSPSSSFGRHA